MYHINKGSQKARINPERYGPDLILEAEGVERFIEVEVKTNWGNDDTFPFPTVNILERKKKFFGQGAELWMLNITMNRALIITPEDMKGVEAVEVPNRYMKSGELFYQVPTGQLKMVRMETLIS
jgi:hypothetical protein